MHVNLKLLGHKDFAEFAASRILLPVYRTLIIKQKKWLRDHGSDVERRRDRKWPTDFSESKNRENLAVQNAVKKLRFYKFV